MGMIGREPARAPLTSADINNDIITADDLVTTLDLSSKTLTLPTLSSATITSVDINGGTIDGVTIGGSSAGAITGTTGQFNTSLNVDGAVTADGLTVDGDATLQANTTSEAPVLTLRNDGDKQAAIVLDADRSSANGSLGQIRGAWNGTAVTRVVMAAGSDTANKDDGRIYLQTAPDGTLKDRLLVDNNGDISFYEDTGTTPKFFWDASAEALGIGTTSPDAILKVTHTIDSPAAIFENARAAGNGTDSAVVRIVSQNRFSNLYITSDPIRSSNLYLGDSDDDDIGSIVYDNSSDSMRFTTNTSEAMRIDSSGRVGIGTSSPSTKLNLRTSASDDGILLEKSDGTDVIRLFHDGGSSNARIDMFSSGSANVQIRALGNSHFSGGNVGIGTSSPGASLHIAADFPELRLEDDAYSGHYCSIDGNGGSGILTLNADAGNDVSNSAIRFLVDNSEKARIDSSGQVGIGTTSPSQKLHVVVDSDSALGSIVKNTNAGTSAASRLILGNDTDNGAGLIRGSSNNTAFGANTLSVYQNLSAPITFWTSNTERMRIDSSGNLLVGTTSASPGDANTAGAALGGIGYISITRDAGVSGQFNRKTNDGTIINLEQDSTLEGTISVSGSTVSYNGGHLSRWSQTPDNTRIELLKGTVMTNLDQMAVWGDEENEQLNCMEVSSVEGDPNVAGVFVNWDDDDTDYTNDMNVAMTGDMIIRIAQGTTVQRGDLLMSAGDGTAKPQGDDIVRSKTIAKVTSTHVTCTYADGSYCVPCVLMAC